MITRERAIEALGQIADCEALKDCLTDAVNDIIMCLQIEQQGLHIWGGAADADILMNEFVEHLCFPPETRAAYPELFRKYSFGTSKFEEAYGRK